jgi:hypothetical protein
MAIKSGGWRLNSLIENNFKKGDATSAKSNRYWWNCNHCDTRIDGRNNNLFEHLTDAIKCINCPQETRREALQHLEAFAIIIPSIVPHAAEVERLFSDLGGMQSVKCCNLSVNTFQTLGKIHANLCYHIHSKNVADGKPTRRHHAHMQQMNFWALIQMSPSSSRLTSHSFRHLQQFPATLAATFEGPESISLMTLMLSLLAFKIFAMEKK